MITPLQGAQIVSIVAGNGIAKEVNLADSIVAENAVIEQNARVGTPPDHTDSDWGVAVVAGGVTVGEGAVVSAHAMVRENVKGGDRV